MNIEIAPKEYERMLEWDDAMMYCQLLAIDDKIDWRLPTKEELNYIYKSENDFVGSGYWANELYGNVAWIQNMSNGTQLAGLKHVSYHVRAVRTI